MKPPSTGETDSRPSFGWSRMIHLRQGLQLDDWGAMLVTLAVARTRLAFASPIE